MKGDPNRPNKGDVVYLEDLPDHVTIAPGAIQVRDVEIPVRLPDGSVGGKARVIEGDDEDVSVLVEIESLTPNGASFFKNARLFEVSLVTEEQMVQDTYIRTVDL